MPQHIMFVFDENDAIIERIPVTNWQHARALEKELKEKYKGRNVRIKDGYVGVSEELYNSTKKLLEDLQEKYPETMQMFEKDRAEFKHLGYDMKKLTRGQIKKLRKQNDDKRRNQSEDESRTE